MSVKIILLGGIFFFVVSTVGFGSELSTATSFNNIGAENNVSVPVPDADIIHVELHESGGGGGGDWCDISAAICNTDWANRMEIVIDNTQVSDADTADFTNFPVMINVTGSIFTNSTYGLDAGADSLEDIRFLNNASTTLLDYEIEKFDQTDNELIAWVEIPTLDYNDNTTIYMYYDNAGSPTDQQNPSGVWDSNYVMVHHMNEASSNIIDSTSNDNDSDAIDGSPTYGATGKVGDAIDFPGNAGFEVPNSNSLDITGNTVTVQAWIKNTEDSAGTGDYPVVWNYGGNDEPYLMFIWSGSSPDTSCSGAVQWGMTFRTRLPAEEACVSATDVTDDVWHLVTGRYDGTNQQIWIDGVQDGTVARTGNLDSTNGKGTIGMYRTDTVLPYEGLIDELHVSNIARSDGWIATSHTNQNAPETFATLTVEAAPSAANIDSATITVKNTDSVSHSYNICVITKAGASISDTAGTSSDCTTTASISASSTGSAVINFENPLSSSSVDYSDISVQQIT